MFECHNSKNHKQINIFTGHRFENRGTDYYDYASGLNFPQLHRATVQPTGLKTARGLTMFAGCVRVCVCSQCITLVLT